MKIKSEKQKTKSEKRINKKRSLPSFFIYPVITTKFCRTMDSVETLKKVLKGGAKVVQLREKDMNKKEILAIAKRFRTWTSKYKVKLIINDHIDIALAVKADGVHLGQDDLPIQDARRLSKKLIIGVSTHNMKEAMAAVRQGADYINIGPIFATNTKETGYCPIGLSKLAKISKKVTIPFTVMGGIKKNHIPLLVKNGAIRIAMVTEITRSVYPDKKMKELMEVLKESII